MRVLVYDYDKHRNDELRAHLEYDNIFAYSACCLKELLTHIEHPSLKVICVEQTCILHYHLDVDSILDKLGLTFLVVEYTKQDGCFHFIFHFIPCYLHQPFTSNRDQKLIQHVRYSLHKLEKTDYDSNIRTKPPPSLQHGKKYTQLKKNMDIFSKKQKQLITILLEEENGLSNKDVIKILQVENKKNKQNYLHKYIYKLRIKLRMIVDSNYILAYKQHRYYLTCTHEK